MKILISSDGFHAHYHIRMSWARVFQNLGAEVSLWNIDSKPVFDAFDEFEPDIFIGQTYHITESLIKCIEERPNLKVMMRASDWGDMQNDIDLDKYPILVATEEEKRLIEKLKKKTGKPDFVHNHYTQEWIDVTHNKWKDIGVNPVSMIHAADTFILNKKAPLKDHLMCDVGFVGGYWDYKSKTLDKYIVNLCHPVGDIDIKIFGGGWPVIQCLGKISDEDLSSFFRSSLVCPNISEPHSQDFGYDIIERPFKILYSGGFCISDFVQSMSDLFNKEEIVFAKTPEELRELIHHYKDNPEERDKHIKQGIKTVEENHTYIDRVGTMLKLLEIEGGQEGCSRLKQNILRK
jgi:hypothetical protein